MAGRAVSYSYDALGALSYAAESETDSIAGTGTADAGGTESYAVFRNEITAAAINSAAVPAVDFFSLDVSAPTVEDSFESPVVVGRKSTPPHPLSSAASVVHGEPSWSSNASESVWFRAGRKFKSPMLQLHKEILDFCNFVSPTREEQGSRSAAVTAVFDVVKYIWPHCKVEVFGSFKTGLYLPSSDIDVVILESKVKTPQTGLYALARALSQRGIARKVQVIAKARVPIIKFVEKRSGVAFDISFDVDSGPKAADFIKDAVSKIPPLRPLCMILKIFLHQRELNEVYTGGIGSYALLTMLIAHLQMQWRGQHQGRQLSMENNLGILLVNFFDLYGCKLNIWDVGVSCKTAGSFFLKSDKGFVNSDRPYLLSIEDPQQPDNDIGRNSYNYFKVRSAFAMAYSSLTDAKAIMGLAPGKSILGTIIRPDPVLLDRRGGLDGTLTFDKLLPGAGEPVFQQFKNGDDILYNWHLVDDEPLPREKIATEDSSQSPLRKRKVTVVKLKSNKIVKQNGLRSKSEEKDKHHNLQVKKKHKKSIER